jgi:acetylglutamate kinase
MDKLNIIKIGGNIIDDEVKLSSFLELFAAVEGKKILVHGGGKLATRIAEAMGVQQQMIDGRRITDAETLKIVTMVYAGYINKNIVAALQANDCNAIGLSGVDGNVIVAHKRVAAVDYGFAGDIDTVNNDLINSLLAATDALVFAPITHDGKGQLLNTNADTIAQEVAKALCNEYEVTLIYSFEKSGVLLDVNDESTVINKMNEPYYKELKKENKVFAGMIPKLDNAFKALHSGVEKVIIGNAESLDQLLIGNIGTQISLT